MIETPIFIRYATAVWDDEEREAFVDWIADHPDSGTVIPGTGGLRKSTLVTNGDGQTGGARVIFFARNTKGEIVLLLVYSKAKFDKLSPDYLLRLKEAFDGS